MRLLIATLSIITTLFSEEIEVSVTYSFDTSSMNIKELIEKERSLFVTKPVTKKETKSATWLRFQLSNTSNKELSCVIHFLDHRIDRLNVYDQKGHLLYEIGDTVAFNTRLYKNPQIAFPIKLKPSRSQMIYVNVLSKGSFDLSHLIESHEEYVSTAFKKHQFYGFYFGAMSLMLLYNLILFFFIRQKAFAYYVIYHSILLVVMFYYSGYMIMYNAPMEDGHDYGSVPPLLIVLSLITATQFARAYLHVKRVTPRLDSWLRLFLGIDLLLGLVSYFEYDLLIYSSVIMITMMIQSLLLMGIGLYHWIVKKSTVALFYFAGWIFMAVGVIITALLSLGSVERDMFTIFSFKVGSLFEVLLLSMGLAYRYNEQKKTIIEKDKALKNINVNLEQIIIKRTQELEAETSHVKTLLNDREILFKELYHRVKNNLQMITSLLSMQNRRIDDEVAHKALDDAQSRIKSIALIHEKLQTNDELDKIDAKSYLETLLVDIQRGFKKENISLLIESDVIALNIEQMTSLGLIVNELSTNSFKYAFEGVLDPTIRVTLKVVKEDIYFDYSDNGSGIEENSTPSLGTLLIETLATKQLRGTLETTTQGRLLYRIRFPLHLETIQR